jgi:NADH-quinone oxidoreductase subunit N
MAFIYFFPEILLGSWILFLAVGGAIVRNYYTDFEQHFLDRFFYVTQALLFICFFVYLSDLASGHFWAEFYFADLLYITFSSQALKAVVLFSFSVVLASSWSFLSVNFLKSLEYLVLSLFSLLAMLLLLSGNDLIVIYILLEFQALSFYILAAYDVASLKSTEAGLKYFLVGSVASILYLLGVSFIYFSFGTTSFSVLKQVLFGFSFDLFSLIGFFLIVIGLLFKIALAPFHVWVADVYEGAVLSVTALFAVVPKLVLLSVIVRVFIVFDNFLVVSGVTEIFLAFSVVSLIIGTLAALYQITIKRLIAYSAVVHVAFLFLSLSIGTYSSFNFLFLYIFVYILLGLNLFSFLLPLHNNATKKEFSALRDFSGLYRSAPVLSFFLVLSFFSLAGIPPLFGFFGKAFVFFSLMEAHYLLLGVVFIVFSAVSAFYYVRVIKVIVYESQETRVFLKPISRLSSYVLTLTSILNLVLVAYLDNLMIFISHIVNSIIV